MTELKPCPFCGIKPVIQLVDDEGNFQPIEYKDEPYSGIGYALLHDVKWNSCPIATCDDEFLGSMIYDSEEEAKNYWNRRVGESDA